MQIQTLRDLYVEQLHDLYSAETQLVEALPKMAKAASHTQLQQAFQACRQYAPAGGLPSGAPPSGVPPGGLPVPSPGS